MERVAACRLARCRWVTSLEHPHVFALVSVCQDSLETRCLVLRVQTERRALLLFRATRGCVKMLFRACTNCWFKLTTLVLKSWNVRASSRSWTPLWAAFSVGSRNISSCCRPPSLSASPVCPLCLQDIEPVSACFASRLLSHSVGGLFLVPCLV